MWRNVLVRATYQLGPLVFLLRRGPDVFGCEDDSRRHFAIISDAFVFLPGLRRVQRAGDWGSVSIRFRRLRRGSVFPSVVAFAVIAQWIVAEFGGGDFAQTAPLAAEERKATARLGAVVHPPWGSLCGWIPAEEDPESFAGVGDGRYGNGRGPGKGKKQLRGGSARDVVGPRSLLRVPINVIGLLGNRC